MKKNKLEWRNSKKSKGNTGDPSYSLKYVQVWYLKWKLRKTNRQPLTIFIKDVMFHKAYTRARPADRLGPWLNKALIPAGKGSRIPRGIINKTRKTSPKESEYNCSKVSNTRLKSPRSRIEITKPTRSCSITRKAFSVRILNTKQTTLFTFIIIYLFIWGTGVAEHTWWPTGLVLWIRKERTKNKSLFSSSTLKLLISRTPPYVFLLQLPSALLWVLPK